MFQNIDKRPGRDIDAGFASNCDRTGFDRMVELAMASFLPNLLSTIQLNHSDKIFDFHAGSLAQPLLGTQPETNLAPISSANEFR